LDEGEGNVAKDSGPAGAHGAIEGATWSRHGRGWTLHFDGVDDLVDCGTAAALDLTGVGMTLSAWVMPDEAPEGEVGICGKHFSSYLLSYYQDAHAYWYIASGGNHAKGAIPPGIWSHVAGTFDGATLRLYINGDLAMERPSKAFAVPAGKRFLVGCVVGDPMADDPNYTQTGFFRGCIADVRVHDRPLAAVEVRQQFEVGAAGRFGVTMAELQRLPLGASVEAGGVRLGVAAGGTVQIEYGGTYLLAESAFSYPGAAMGWNRLGSTAEGSEADWTPEVTTTAAGALCVTAAGASYRLERTLAVEGNRILVSDTFTNPAAEPVGIVIRHRLATPLSFVRPRIGLRACDSFVFGATPEMDVGVLAEDDVSRAMFAGFCQGNTLGFRLGNFGLAGGTTYTFRWLIYLLPPTQNPLALVHRVRYDFGSNHTIPGPCSFFDAAGPLVDDPAALRAYLERRPLGIAMLSPWLDYDPGSISYTLSRQDYKTMMQRALRALKAVSPGLRVIGCIETDWVGIFPDRIPAGEKLPSPRSGATGSAWLEGEAAQVIRDSKLPWLDSLKLDAKGRPVLELYTRGGKPQWALGVYPAPGNYQARFLLEQARFLCEEVGLDGWYIDEFNPYWVKSHDRWDGYSVSIDTGTGRILKRYSDASLAGIGPRLDLCRYAVEHGYTMLCNTYASTFAESRLPVLRFAETWASFDPRGLPASGIPPWFPELASSQLGTMIGLGANGLDLKLPSAELLMRSLVTYLRHSMVYYHYFYGDLPTAGEGSGEYGPINHMFPITPVRLFEGGIEGRERTVTALSGSYPWRLPQKPVVRVFGTDGRPTLSQAVIESAEGGWRVRLALDDWRQIAVISEH
jgi:hypothetical protein